MSEKIYDAHGWEIEEPITTHKLPCSDISEHDYCFSNGIEYVPPIDRYNYRGLSREEYHKGFSERDKWLDDAINRGRDLHCDSDLWRVYDDAVLNYGLDPIDPYEWLFNHATLSDKSIIISQPHKRILLVSTSVKAEYYVFIHGINKYWARYARAVD